MAEQRNGNKKPPNYEPTPGQIADEARKLRFARLDAMERGERTIEPQAPQPARVPVRKRAF